MYGETGWQTEDSPTQGLIHLESISILLVNKIDDISTIRFDETALTYYMYYLASVFNVECR